MLSLELSVNIVVILAMLALSGLAGFGIRARQMVKIRAKLCKAENEMLRSHAEILELQKEFLSMEQNLRNIKDPVCIVMSGSSHTEMDKKLPNAALRKKLLTDDLTQTHIKAIS